MKGIIVNLTPHAVVIDAPQGYVGIASQGNARIEMEHEPMGLLETPACAIPIETTTPGDVTGLPPEEEEGKYYIVSTQVRMALPHRKDLLSPGELIRDKYGKPVATKTLVRNR